MNFIYLIFLGLSFQALAQEVPSSKEVETYLEAINDKKIEEQLLATDKFSNCKEISNKDGLSREDKISEFEKCMKNELNGSTGELKYTDEEIEQLAKTLDMRSFNKEASKTATSIKEYLTLRLRKALFGVEDLEKSNFKDRNFVNHDVFYDLYAEQIGKNTLLEVSRYCLENFAIAKSTNLYWAKKVEVTDKNGKTSEQLKVQVVPRFALEKSDPTLGDGVETYTDNIASLDNLKEKYDNLSSSSNPPLLSFPELVQSSNQKPIETVVCNLKSEQECNKLYSDQDRSNQEFKTLAQIEALKNAEYNLAQIVGGGDPRLLLEANYMFCASSVIKNMCEIYKCNNVYKGELAEDCDKNYGIKSPPQKPSDTGKQACAVLQRLTDYRSALKVTKDIIAENRQMGSSRTGFKLGDVYKGKYESRGKDTVDRLTSISSQELTNKVSDINDSETYAEELKKTCLDENGVLVPGAIEKNKDCELLASKLNDEKFQNIQEKEISVTELQKERLLKLGEDASLEDLMTFLKENGMSEYIIQEKDGTYSGKFAEMAKAGETKKIIDAVIAEIETRKKTTIEGIKERFYSQTKIKAQPENAEENTKFENLAAEEALADIETHKRRVKALFEYSNIVSSYLSLEDEQGQKIGENSTVREVELANQDTDTISKYFTDSSGGSSAGSSASNIDYLQAIDAVIGIDKVKDETKP